MMVLVSLLTLTSCNGKAKKGAVAELEEVAAQVTFANMNEVTTSFQLAARSKKGNILLIGKVIMKQ